MGFIRACLDPAVMMTLHQLKVFVAVAKFRSFSLAGEELRLHQPSVSIAVRGLERQLEVKLFENLGRKVHLTRAGEELLRIAGEVMPKVGGIKERLAEVMGLKKGRIRVGGSAIAAASFLPGAVQKFKRGYPGVEVVLKVERSDSLEQKLLEGELDLAVLGRPPRSAHLVGESYRDEEIIVIAGRNHRLAKKRYVPLGLLAKEPLISQEKGTLIRDMVERRFAENGFPFAPVLEVDVHHGGGRGAIRSGVAGGLGIGFISQCHVVGDVEAGRLKVLNVPELKLKRTMYVAMHKNKQGCPLGQAFTNLLRGCNKDGS
jgi:DNA-binding transcriptional LysR family regulator